MKKQSMIGECQDLDLADGQLQLHANQEWATVACGNTCFCTGLMSGIEANHEGHLAPACMLVSD